MPEQRRFAARGSEFRFDYDHTWGRIQFMEAVARMAPDVLKCLHRDVYPAYLAVKPKSPRMLRALQTDPARHEPVLETIRPFVRLWAEQFHLNGPASQLPHHWDRVGLVGWMEPIILETLMSWDVAGPSSSWSYPSQYCAGAFLDMPAAFRVECDGWAILRETRSGFEARVTADFKKTLQAYVENRECEAKKHWWTRLPQRVTTDQLDWLVAYQVNRLSHNKISADANRSRQAVSADIKKAAQLVAGSNYRAWLMPPLPPGRRPA
jgi:hypothetical protein